ncbi:hypothetical protein AJ80_06083 [Polytolypa hystricis UAMH7299]|uniref:Rhodanese domain-containing protein n=1 Tax=Polytolypa hystricis (strain UAMH7299) TaxID=1447883 RepID=A0A2B7XYT2_POLH7|nr:hypothetical protein AJ80_06083 [Polytolypa hystricis UAMH7299]
MATSAPTTAVAPGGEVPWHASFPAPKTKAAIITRSEVLPWLESGTKDTTDFVLIDLRRADYEGGTIATSINLPAQSLYPTIPTLFSIFKQAGIKKVIWYCGSSAGRGTRAGGWFADYIQTRDDADGMQSLVLEGGIKGWAKAGEEYVAKIEGYDPSVWHKFD